MKGIRTRLAHFATSIVLLGLALLQFPFCSTVVERGKWKRTILIGFAILMSPVTIALAIYDRLTQTKGR